MDARDKPEGQAHSVEAEQLGAVHHHGHVAHIDGPVAIQAPQEC